MKTVNHTFMETRDMATVAVKADDEFIIIKRVDRQDPLPGRYPKRGAELHHYSGAEANTHGFIRNRDFAQTQAALVNVSLEGFLS